MPWELKDIFFVYHRHLQRAGLLPLPRRCCISLEGILQLPGGPTGRIQCFWGLWLNHSALNCKNKAYTYSFILSCSVSLHPRGTTNTWQCTYRWLSLHRKQWWSSEGSAVSEVQNVPHLSLSMLWSCLWCSVLDYYHGNDYIFPLLSFVLLPSLNVPHSWQLITDCKRIIAPSSW